MSDDAQAGFGDDRRSLVAYFAHNPVAANVLMLLLLGGGLFVANRATVERFPAYDPHTITVSVPYRGAAPAEVEEEITRRVEESVAGIVDVERVPVHGRSRYRHRRRGVQPAGGRGGGC